MITVYFDMTNTGMKNMDMDLIQYMIHLFKSYYPWFLNYIIVFEMPWLLSGKMMLSLLNLSSVCYVSLYCCRHFAYHHC